MNISASQAPRYTPTGLLTFPIEGNASLSRNEAIAQVERIASEVDHIAVNSRAASERVAGTGVSLFRQPQAAASIMSSTLSMLGDAKTRLFETRRAAEALASIGVGNPWSEPALASSSTLGKLVDARNTLDGDIGHATRTLADNPSRAGVVILRDAIANEFDRFASAATDAAASIRQLAATFSPQAAAS